MDAPADGIGSSGVVVPSAGDLVNYTLTYDPNSNSVESTVTDTTSGASTSVEYAITGPFAGATPGDYLFGVGSETGGAYANWTAKDIYLTGLDGVTTTILSSAPNPIEHVPIEVSGSQSPVFDASTGALELIPSPAMSLYGLGVFDYDYGGGNLSMTLLANYTVSSGFPSDGLNLYLFMSPDLVSSFPPNGVLSEPPSSTYLPVSNEYHVYPISGNIGFPQASAPYFTLQWDPAWYDYYDTPEFSVWEPYATGTYVSSLSVAPSTVAVGHPATLRTVFAGSPLNESFYYGGLPAGCVSENLSTLTCTPSTPGMYSLFVNVTGGGDTWNLAFANLSVLLGPSPGTSWSEFHGDASHAGLASSSGPTSSAVNWSASTSAGSGGITVSGPYLLVTEAGGDGAAGGASPYVFNSSNGTSAGSLPSSTLGTGYAPIANGVAYFESYSCGFLYCSCSLVAEWISNGTSLWGDGVGCSPSFNSEFGWEPVSVDDGLVFFAPQDSSGLTAYYATNGTTAWSIALPSGAWGTVTAGAGVVVIGYNGDDLLSAYNETTGASAWSVPINGTLASPAAFANGDFYFGTTNGIAYAVSSEGSVLWDVGTGSPIETTPAVDGGTVVEATYAGAVLALNASDGLTVWDYETGSTLVASPAISANGIVYVGAESDTLFALDESSGSLLWSTNLTAAITSAPAIANGGLYVLTSDGNVWAFTSSLNRFDLNVTVMQSDGAPVAGAEVVAGNATGLTASAYTDPAGEASFTLPGATYNVSASYSGLDPDAQNVSLTSSMAVDLTLTPPYDFLGMIPASHLNITDTPSGYQVSLLSMFPNSAAQIFFNWVPVGNISAGSSWVNFSASDVPNYIVMAAAPGSVDYPDAYYANPSGTELPPSDSGCGAFQDVSQNPWNPSITANPDPPVVNESTNVTVELYNNCPFALNITELNFEISGITAGGTGWLPVGTITNITLAPGETKNVSVLWNSQFTPSAVGLHHCVRIYVTYSGTPPPQCPQNFCAIQHNLEFEPNLLSGQQGSVPFTLGSVGAESAIADVTVTMHAPAHWTETVLMNGETFSGPGTYSIRLMAGQTVGGTLTITPNASKPGFGFVNVSVSIGGVPEGGFQKEMQELKAGHYGVAFDEEGLGSGTSWSVTFDGTTKTMTTSSILFNAPDGSYGFSVGSVAGFAATPSSGEVVVNGAAATQSIDFTLADLGPEYCYAYSPGAFGFASGLSADYEGDYSSGSLDFHGGLTLTPTLSICLGTTAGAFGLPSGPAFLNITETLDEQAQAGVEATGTFQYSNDDPTVLAGPILLAGFCVSILPPICFDVTAEIDLEIDASLTESGNIEFDQGVELQSSQNYSFTTSAWTQVPVTESCLDPSDSLSNGCTSFTSGASIQGDLDLRLGPMVDLEADGIAGVFFYPYAELDLAAGYSTSGGQTEDCGTGTIGWDLADPWAAACVNFGIEVGGNVLDTEFDTTDWDIFSFPVAGSVLTCSEGAESTCGSSFTVASGQTLTLQANAAASGADFSWTSPCLSAPVEGATLVFTAPGSGPETCTYTVGTGFLLVIPSLSISEETVTISVGATYGVTFDAGSLASAKQHWSVTLGDDTVDPTGPSSVTFHVTNGTYPYVIWGPYGFDVSGLAPAGNVTVNGTSITVNGAPLEPFAFVRGTTYRISFVEMGLPQRAEWCAAVGGTICTANRTISFHALTPGEYPYSIPLVPGESVAAYLNGTEIPLSGWVHVSGHVRIVLRFASDPAAPRGAGVEPPAPSSARATSPGSALLRPNPMFLGWTDLSAIATRETAASPRFAGR